MIAILYVVVQAMGVPITQWVLTVLGIVFVACVCILSIKFLTGNGPPQT